jgi:hypothetical protein
VLIKTEERSNIIEIPRDIFDEHIREYYLENLESTIQFYRELLFGDKLELEHLLPLVSVTQMRKVPGNVVVIKQGDLAKNIYFIK